MSNYRVYSTFSSALITVAMHWTHRLIGVISIAILARLLEPQDFGIIAMATLIIALADVLLNFGVHVSLIQKQEATQAHYDTAWTIRLIQTAASTVALYFTAPLAAIYFQDPRVEIVVEVLAFSLLLGGLENIGIIDFQKKMQFGVEFRFRFLRHISGFFVTLALAIVMRSYWALVIGMLVEKSIGVLLSYWLHSMRPRLSFAKFAEIFSVSQWMLLYNIGRFLRMKLHRILVGRWEPAEIMGAYTLADEISLMPTTAILAPVNRALFPAFAKAQGDRTGLKDLYLLAQGVQTLIAVPAAAGLALVAPEVVHLLLGPAWLQAIPFVQILALINIAQALTTSGGYILLATGHARLNALFTWAQVALFCGLALTPFFDSTAIDVAWLALTVAAIALWLQFWILVRTMPTLTFLEILSVSSRPLVAASIMAFVLNYLPDLAWPTLDLLLKVGVGGTVYCSLVPLLWAVMGRPQGAETYIFDRTKKIWKPPILLINRWLKR